MNDAQRALRERIEDVVEPIIRRAETKYIEEGTVAFNVADAVLDLLAESEPTEAAKDPVAAPEVTDLRDGTFCLNPKPHKPHVYTACPDLYMQPTRNCPGLTVDPRIGNLRWIRKNVEAWPGETREMVLLLIEELERYRLLS